MDLREKNYMPLKTLFIYNLLSVCTYYFAFLPPEKQKNFIISKKFINDTPSTKILWYKFLKVY